MRRFWMYAAASAIMLLLALPSHAQQIHCVLTYSLSGGGAFIKRAAGEGVIRCDNGQSMRVDIQSKGGGLTFGHSEIDTGSGKFSATTDIYDLIGRYISAEANAGSSKNANNAQLLKKGAVSLRLSGKGKGRTIGISFGSFTISQRANEDSN